MSLEEIVEIINNAHRGYDPDTVEGIVAISQEICDELGSDGEGEWWTADAMIAIAEAAYEA